MEPAHSERRERKDARRNQEQVIAAARELFARHGAEVRIEEVARRAGVGVATVYRCFASKERLIAAISHDACSMAQQHLHEAAQCSGDPIARLQALIRVQFHNSAQQAALLELSDEQRDAHDALFESRPLLDALHALLEQIIADGQRQGQIRSGDASALAGLCIELLTPRAFARLSHMIGGSPDELAAHAADFILRGLAADRS
jgi:AcrR family transcriptional regulator